MGVAQNEPRPISNNKAEQIEEQIMPKTKSTKRRKEEAAWVPYARGFKPPTVKQSEDAIMNKRKSSTPPVLLPPHLQPTGGHFGAIRQPVCQDDWLAQYNEEGQDYTGFIQECPWMSTRKWKIGGGQRFDSKGHNIKEKYPEGKIYLLQLGDFDKGESLYPSFQELVKYVEIFYDLPVSEMKGVELKKDGDDYKIVISPAAVSCETKKRRSSRTIRHTLEHRYNSKTRHLQLDITSILFSLKPHLPADALFLIALTMHDLFSDPRDLFVAGMAAGNHRVGVFSFSRYDPSISFSPENWYEISYHDNDDEEQTEEEEGKRVILERSCKLLVHEIGHLLGLDHCIWYECLMNGSGHLEEDFRQPMFLCPVDLHKVETLCGFDVIRRYERLREFFKRHKMRKEETWVQGRLEFIRNGDSK